MDRAGHIRSPQLHQEPLLGQPIDDEIRRATPLRRSRSIKHRHGRKRSSSGPYQNQLPFVAYLPVARLTRESYASSIGESEESSYDDTPMNRKRWTFGSPKGFSMADLHAAELARSRPSSPESTGEGSVRPASSKSSCRSTTSYTVETAETADTEHGSPRPIPIASPFGSARKLPDRTLSSIDLFCDSGRGSTPMSISHGSHMTRRHSGQQSTPRSSTPTRTVTGSAGTTPMATAAATATTTARAPPPVARRTQRQFRRSLILARNEFYLPPILPDTPPPVVMPREGPGPATQYNYSSYASSSTETFSTDVPPCIPCASRRSPRTPHHHLPHSVSRTDDVPTPGTRGCVPGPFPPGGMFMPLPAPRRPGLNAKQSFRTLFARSPQGRSPCGPTADQRTADGMRRYEDQQRVAKGNDAGWREQLLADALTGSFGATYISSPVEKGKGKATSAGIDSDMPESSTSKKHRKGHQRRAGSTPTAVRPIVQPSPDTRHRRSSNPPVKSAEVVRQTADCQTIPQHGRRRPPLRLAVGRPLAELPEALTPVATSQDDSAGIPTPTQRLSTAPSPTQCSPSVPTATQRPATIPSASQSVGPTPSQLSITRPPETPRTAQRPTAQPTAARVKGPGKRRQSEEQPAAPVRIPAPMRANTAPAPVTLLRTTVSEQPHLVPFPVSGNDASPRSELQYQGTNPLHSPPRTPPPLHEQLHAQPRSIIEALLLPSPPRLSTKTTRYGYPGYMREHIGGVSGVSDISQQSRLSELSEMSHLSDLSGMSSSPRGILEDLMRRDAADYDDDLDISLGYGWRF